MPVLPEVASAMTMPGLSLPSRSASSIRYLATRSLMEPPGLRNSALPKTVVLRLLWSWTATTGVWPIKESTLLICSVFASLTVDTIFHPFVMRCFGPRFGLDLCTARLASASSDAK